MCEGGGRGGEEDTGGREADAHKPNLFMLTGGTPAAAGGPRQSAETGIARAETLGPDVGQRTWKPGPGGAVGPTDAKESAHNLFPLGSIRRSAAIGGKRRGGSQHGLAGPSRLASL
jgi:hypothetical protein